MRVTVFGATGGVGRQVVERALAAGHEVHALVRDPARLDLPGVSVTAGDLADGQAIDRAVEGSDAVIWAVGATENKAEQVDLFETAARELVATMKRHGVRRLVALSGAAITLDGERKPIRGRLTSGLVALLVRHVVEAKRREYRIFRDSGLDWTLVRPPRVVEGGPTGELVASSTLTGSRITQADLAAFMVAQLGDASSIGRAPFVSS